MDRVSRVVALAAMACLLSPTAHAAALNDTGQITCFNATATSTGSVSIGDPAPEAAGFAGQDCSLGASAADAVGAQVKIGGASVPGRDYSKIANDGSELPDTANLGSAPGDWGCTRDNVSGLIWELRPDDGSLRDRNHRFSWKNVSSGEPNTCGGQVASCNTDAYVAAINTTGHCGASDWRLPTPAQLEGLLAYADPAATRNLIDRSWFPDQAFDEVLLQHVFWSDSAADTGNLAWATDFDFGLSAVTPRENAAFVRLVRAAAAPATPRFSTSDPQSSGEIVVRDAYTGLQWKQCPQGLSGASCTGGTLASLTWSNALASAAAESFAGASDWRLPNIIELASIRDYTPVVFPAVALSAEFAGTASNDAHWSSTNDPRPDSLANAYTYTYGESTAHNPASKTAQPAAVRLVRGGNFLAAHAPGADTTPAALVFGGKSTPAGSLVESDPITVTGITGPTSLKVTGAAQSSFSINGGSWGSGIGAVINGQAVRVRHLAAATVGEVATTTLTIGGTSGSFNSTASATAPGFPTGVNATRGNASATVTFSAPASDGGSAITAYTAISNPGGGSSSCTITPPLSCTVTNLINGQAYTFTVSATNAAGTGVASVASNAVTPATVPGKPTNVSATAGVASALVTFTPPLNNGGAAITAYSAQSAPPGGSSTCAVSPPYSCSVTGLANGTAYTFTVTATNPAGPSEPSEASASVTTPTAPGAPTNVMAAPGNAQATVTYAAPANNGGSTIIDYKVTSSGGQTQTCAGLTCTVSGLTNGTSYTFWVQARNAVGLGTASPNSSSVSPGVPPTIVFEKTRSTFPRNHNTRFVFLPVADHVLRIGDANGGSAALTVTVTSDNPSVFGSGSLAALKNFGNPDLVGGVLKPTKDAFGSATITYRVTNPNSGLSAQASVFITVTEDNLPPTARYSVPTPPDFFPPAAIRLPGTGGPGDYEVPGFLVNSSPGSGEGNAQSVSFRVAPVGISSASLRNDGTLSFTLPDTGGDKVVFIWPVDDGPGDSGKCADGTYWFFVANNQLGYPTGLSNDSTAPTTGPCGPVRAIVIRHDADSRSSPYAAGFTTARIVSASSSAAKRVGAKQSAAMTYAIGVSNVGSEPILGLRVTARLPRGLGAPSWSCTAENVTCSPASGRAAVSTLVDLDPDQIAVIEVTGTVTEGTGFVELIAEVEFPDGIEGELIPFGSHLIDAVSSGFIHYGGFEGGN